MFHPQNVCAEYQMSQTYNARNRLPLQIPRRNPTRQHRVNKRSSIQGQVLVGIPRRRIPRSEVVPCLLQHVSTSKHHHKSLPQQHVPTSTGLKINNQNPTIYLLKAPVVGIIIQSIYITKRKHITITYSISHTNISS